MQQKCRAAEPHAERLLCHLCPDITDVAVQRAPPAQPYLPFPNPLPRAPNLLVPHRLLQSSLWRVLGSGLP